MRFDGTQRFDAPLSDVVEWYASGEVARRLPALGALSAPELIAATTKGDRKVVAVRYRLTANLPPAATAILDPNRLSWVEETTYHLDHTATVEFRPDHYADRMTASAAVRFVERGIGCERMVKGDVRVRALLVGGQVERVIVGDLKNHLAAEQDAVAELFIDAS